MVPSSELVVASLRRAELGTAQPQPVFYCVSQDLHSPDLTVKCKGNNNQQKENSCCQEDAVVFFKIISTVLQQAT